MGITNDQFPFIFLMVLNDPKCKEKSRHDLLRLWLLRVACLDIIYCPPVPPVNNYVLTCSNITGVLPCCQAGKDHPAGGRDWGGAGGASQSVSGHQVAQSRHSRRSLERLQWREGNISNNIGVWTGEESPAETLANLNIANNKWKLKLVQQNVKCRIFSK